MGNMWEGGKFRSVRYWQYFRQLTVYGNDISLDVQRIMVGNLFWNLPKKVKINMGKTAIIIGYNDGVKYGFYTFHSLLFS